MNRFKLKQHSTVHALVCRLHQALSAAQILEAMNRHNNEEFSEIMLKGFAGEVSQAASRKSSKHQAESVPSIKLTNRKVNSSSSITQ